MVHLAEHDRRRRAVVALKPADQHVGAVGREDQLGERSGEAGARLDQGHQRARGEVDALEHALPFQRDFAGEPVLGIGFQEFVVGEDGFGIALRLEHDHRGVELVQANIENGIVQFASKPQRPELGALRHHIVGGFWRRGVGPAQGDGREPPGSGELHGDGAVFDAIRRMLALEGLQRNPLGVPRTIGLGREFFHPLLHHLIQLGVRHHLVDQPPFDRALALDALFRRAEHVGMIAAHLALVGDAGEPAGSRQHREQRQLRQRHGRGTVVGQDDVVGGERQFIAAAGAGAGYDADHALAGKFAGILDGVAGLVGELAEVDLVGMRRARQHADVGAGAEHLWLAGAQQDDAHLRMLEAEPLQRVGKLDIDPKIVGIELELIAFEQRRILVDVHQQRRDVAVDRKLPVVIARGIGGEIDSGRAV